MDSLFILLVQQLPHIPDHLFSPQLVRNDFSFRPQMLTMDNGSEFIGNEVKNFLRLWGVRMRYTLPYNPGANGQAEAAVRITTRRLYTALGEATQRMGVTRVPFKSWVRYLPYVVMAYNLSPNRITGISPYEVVFGRVPPFPIPNPEEHYLRPTEEGLSDYLLSLKTALAGIQETTSQKLRNRQEQVKRMFDKFRRPLEVKRGDYVYVYYPKAKKLEKLHPLATGPFLVTDVSYLAGTHSPTGVTVNTGTNERPEYRRFARERVHPLSFVHRDVRWKAISDFANKCRGGTQEFLKEFDRAVDHTAVTRGGNRRIEQQDLGHNDQGMRSGLF